MPQRSCRKYFVLQASEACAGVQLPAAKTLSSLKFQAARCQASTPASRQALCIHTARARLNERMLSNVVRSAAIEGLLVAAAEPLIDRDRPVRQGSLTWHFASSRRGSRVKYAVAAPLDSRPLGNQSRAETSDGTKPKLPKVDSREQKAREHTPS